MNYLPIFIDITQKPCLVVGGGDIAYRKINLLLKANAQVICVAQACCEGITQLAKNNKITVIEKAFESSDIKSQMLIVSATNDRALNAQVSDLAKDANIPVNVVDSPDLCTFIMPSIVDRSQLRPFHYRYSHQVAFANLVWLRQLFLRKLFLQPHLKRLFPKNNAYLRYY
jgi:uroporphyrin-III C-methyltransferase/precorrin-2 dehydrogenase/sirohydrochlorin ferrochelatase